MRSQSGCLVRLVPILVILIIVGVASAILLLPSHLQDLEQYAVDYFDKPVSSASTEVLFHVNPGENATTIGERLRAEGLIQSADVFRFLVTYYGISGGLEAGEYELRPNMTVTEIITVIHKGLVKTTLVTIPEGWRTTQIADALSKQGIFGKDEFLKAAGEGKYGYDFLSGRSGDSYLEGYLFPDTYRISPSIGAADLVNYLLKNFDQQVTPSMRSKITSSGMTLNAIITLASIVERESAIASERSLIASVFLNRLELGMPLQADATVQFAIASDPGSVAKFGFWKIGLTQPDLDVVSPYNTYRNKGLPPGPICNPGLASIQAVIEPADSNYLYFVATGDGSHAFAKTLDEHERNIRRYQR